MCMYKDWWLRSDKQRHADKTRARHDRSSAKMGCLRSRPHSKNMAVPWGHHTAAVRGHRRLAIEGDKAERC